MKVAFGKSEPKVFLCVFFLFELTFQNTANVIKRSISPVQPKGFALIISLNYIKNALYSQIILGFYSVQKANYESARLSGKAPSLIIYVCFVLCCILLCSDALHFTLSLMLMVLMLFLFLFSFTFSFLYVKFSFANYK